MKIEFSIGETQFAAVQIKNRSLYWLLHIAETGILHGPGMGGISNDSVPKMKASIQRLLDEVSQGDVKDFRARFSLPAKPSEKLPRVMIVPYGHSTLATEDGYEHDGDIESTAPEILSNHFGEDSIFVQLDHVPGKPRVYKYAKYAQRPATHRKNLLSNLLQERHIPLLDGNWVKLGGNGTGYWVELFYDATGLQTGTTGGHIFPRDAAMASYERHAERFDIPRLTRLLEGVEAYPAWALDAAQVN